MRSIQFWPRVLVVIILHLLGPGIAWTQELPPPRIDEEISKQEKIYRSRGAEVPSGYVVGRGLADYAQLLPGGFCDALGKLGGADRWLDIGAGTGQAILDYFTPTDGIPAREKCASPGGKGRAVAMSIEDRRTDKWHQVAASLGGGRIRYLHGKRLRQHAPEDLGNFQLITDVFGGFSYTENLSQFVDRVLSLLEIGGSFFTLASGVRLENAEDKIGILYLTELEDPIGRREKVCSWLKKATCAQVTCESKSDWKRPTELITMRKVCSDAAVPRMKLVEFEAGYPPSRRFQLE